MEKLDWQFVDHGGTYGAGYQKAAYHGLVIEAHQDSNAECPFESWDCEPPTAVYSGRHNDESDYSGGVVQRPLDYLPDSKLRLRRYWEPAARALGVSDPAAWRADLEREAADYGDSIVDTMRERLESDLEAMRPGYYVNAGDYTSALAALWNLAGVPAVDWVSRGYSQGDYADGITVATPAWRETVGAPLEGLEAQLEAARDLWGAWAWGDVYGWVIRAAGPDGEADGDTLDSCWGYYGTDHGDSGLEESALEAADSILAAARKRKAARLAELIRNRVPLAVRPAELAAAGELLGNW